LRAGRPLRAALEEWHSYVAPDLQAPLAKAGRRLGLGAGLNDIEGDLAAFFGPYVSSLLDLMAVHGRSGAGLGRFLDALATAVAERGAAQARARAAGTGARTSGRLIAALPVLALPLAPVGRAPLLDPVGVACLTAGIGLALGGMAWMERLVPGPPASDPAAHLAETTAGLLSAGLGVTAALEQAIRHHATSWPEAEHARRLALLGKPWPQALAQSGDDGLEGLAAAVARADRLGVPVVESLMSFAAWRRREKELSFERRAHRAPVLMVMPLTLCVLPAFLLVCVVPFLRGLAVGS
jgi:tight adherence protein B